MPRLIMRTSAGRLLWLVSTLFMLTMACVGGRERADPSTVTILYPGNERVLGIEGSVLGYANPDVVHLLEQVGSSFDPAIIDRLYAELMPLLQADLPMTYLYPDVRSTVAHRRLRGLSSPYRAEPTWHMEELWIEEE